MSTDPTDPGPGPAHPTADPAPPSGTRGTSTRGIAAATGVPWTEWTAHLEAAGARTMTHAQVAAHLVGQLAGRVANPDWWAQSIAVAWEQHTGARRPGQTGDGRYNVSASRTLPGDPEAVMECWRDLVAGRTEIGGVRFAAAPAESATEKWRYWRVRLADGTRVAVTVGRRGPERSALAVAHQGLAAAADVEPWRVVWRDLLRRL